MSHYNDTTLHLLSQLSHEHLDIAEKDGKVILAIPEEEYRAILPAGHQLVQDIILLPMQDKETQTMLAQRYGVDKSTISGVISAKKARHLKWELAMCAIMLMDPLPSIRDADHMLMQLSQPGLFISTGIPRENRRNWLLREIITYCAQQSRPPEGWLDFANQVLLFFHYTPLKQDPPSPSCPVPPQDWLSKLQTQLQDINYVDYTILRRSLFQRYLERNQLNYYGGIQKAEEQLAADANISVSTVHQFFGTITNTNTKCGRGSLIQLAIALGCSLKETNAMLLQVNEALLYPNRSNKEEVEWTRRLCRNDPNDLL